MKAIMISAGVTAAGVFIALGAWELTKMYAPEVASYAMSFFTSVPVTGG